jgi:D-lactate dehydrogenase (cytochrome)
MAMTEAREGLKHDRKAIEAVIAALAANFGNRLVTSRAVREQHANTLTWVGNQPPDAVVFPQSTEDVQQVVRLCAAERVPVIPFGAGTSLEGQVNAPHGGVSLDFRDMNRLLAVHAEDLDCVVEPGITRKQLNEQLRDQGVFFPIDPGADASLGGMAATRASGTNAVRYGTMKDNVLALKVVLANGEVMSTARRAKKSSAGYDLTRLIVGSEGTLGIITELTLRLAGIPEAISSGVCPFPSVEAACNATIMTIQSGIPVARIELLDTLQVRASNAYSKLALPETPVLFLEFHGTEASVAEQSQRFGEIAQEFGGGPFDWATRAEDRTRLWQARHDAYWAQRGLRPNGQPLATDVCVPISRLAECVTETQRDIAQSNLVAPIVGHVGDGNFHVGLMVDLDDEE